MLIALLLLAAASPQPFQQRCGWLINPTPQNWWLLDRDGEWTLSTQGGPEIEGWEDLPPLHRSSWVETNGSYGYGCACATMLVDRKSGKALAIRSWTARPLKACRADRRLPKP